MMFIFQARPHPGFGAQCCRMGRALYCLHAMEGARQCLRHGLSSRTPMLALLRVSVLE